MITTAIREIQEVKSGVVTVTLPPDFRASRVEIIVLALEDRNPQRLQDLALAAPILTADELQEYTEVSEWMRGRFAHEL